MVASKEIIEGIEIVDLCLYLTEENILILGDIHLGYEDTLKSKGFLIPKQQFKLTMKRIYEIINFIRKKHQITILNRIIINGDLKHEFGTIQRAEWNETLDLIDILQKECEELIVIKGNHDKIIQPILNKRDIIAKEHYISGKEKDNQTLIGHGDFIPEEINKPEVIIIGHEHPAIKLKQYPRTETYKTFVKTKWNNKDLIVMPSFNLLSEGSNILENKFLSPFLKSNINKPRIEGKELFVVSEEDIFHFPSVDLI